MTSTHHDHTARTPGAGAPVVRGAARRRLWHRTGWAWPAVLVVLAATACTHASTSASTSPLTTTPEHTVADPETVLNQLAAELRAEVDALTKDVKTTFRGVTGNDSGVCGTPTHNRWPRQWGYGQRLFLTEPDSRPTAHRLAETLRAQGWTVGTHRDDGANLELTIQKDGAVISINAESTGGGLAVVGDSACVNADGTVDHRPVG
jgi:hypothetical protein